MGLRLYNTLTRSVQDFQPLDPNGKHVGLYCCGPTVHDYAHIGNFRTFAFADLLRRYLEFKGYAVRHVMNVTDVEDKIIARVRAQGIPLRDYTSRFEKAFFDDLAALGCRTPHETPHATEHIEGIVSLIATLMERGLAYHAPDGSVYFSIEKYRSAGHCYGQLAQLDFEQMRPGTRVQSDDYAKESIADFALWKARVPDDGEIFWESPWGQGRPGWHIECSAMSMKILGHSFDLHVGGEDLVFPHHEDEIAQSEGAGLQAPGCRFVQYWLHGAHLMVEGKKMSKSLGNFYTLRDLLAKGFNGRELRFLLLSAHYRETFNFTLDGVNGARSALARLDECLAKLKEIAGDQTATASPTVVENFATAMDDNLNVSAAWAVVFDWVRDTNRRLADHQVSPADAASALAAWERIDSVFGVGVKPAAEAPAQAVQLMEERQAARKAKDFRRADQIREELKAIGWAVEDTAKGPRLRPLIS